MSRVKLCVNIDHIATVRQARGGSEPDLLEGARICEENGSCGITVHLREDRRHIQDSDVFLLKKKVRGKLNLEMALSDEIIRIAKKVVPHQITLVPEKRRELTTEGGLDVARNFRKLQRVIREFRDLGITVSLFVEPEIKIVEASKDSGADFIEIHTGTYCNAAGKRAVDRELRRIYAAADCAARIGIGVNAGHGLNYSNILPVLKARGLHEVNIGHSIISRSIMTGLPEAVKKMAAIIAGAR